MSVIESIKEVVGISSSTSSKTSEADSAKSNSAKTDSTKTKQDEIVLRRPRVSDGADMWALARKTGVLDLNSGYAYLMAARWFNRSCVVAELEGRIVGFITGFRPHGNPEALFIWQVGVDSAAQGRGVASRMLDFLISNAPEPPVSHIETTVTPSNEASDAMFRSFARRHGAEVEVSLCFKDSLLPADGKESEMLYHIGPLAEAAGAEGKAHETEGETAEMKDRDTADTTTPEGASRAASTGVAKGDLVPGGTPETSTFERLESEVRSYCRSFPTVFERGVGHLLIDARGKEYIDFFAGAGALSYGHNNPRLKSALMDYLAADGVTHSLDMFSAAKGHFLERFQETILAPRGMGYKVQFTGPTGTNAVEAALKLARKVTGRQNVIAFTNGFHGMTLGSLAATGNAMKRAGAGLTLGNITRMPFDGYLGEGVDTLDYLEAMLDDAGSGIDLPAAAIVETIQAEGGVKLASFEWLRRLRSILDRHGVLLIVDDIQVGCGRTGPFFSFERAGIEPDLITLSKSLSGFGLPFAVVLLKPEHDKWAPGEHNATFRGHNLAFVTAAAALSYWENDDLTKEVEAKAAVAREGLSELISVDPRAAGEVRGRGLIQGVEFENRDLAGAVSAEAFKRGVIMETSGIDDQVLKLLPPLTIPEEALTRGISILRESLDAVLARTDGPRN